MNHSFIKLIDLPTSLYYIHRRNRFPLGYTFRNRVSQIRLIKIALRRSSFRKTMLLETVREWCKQNKIKYKRIYVDNEAGFSFYSPENALAFKLRWL